MDTDKIPDFSYSTNKINWKDEDDDNRSPILAVNLEVGKTYEIYARSFGSEKYYKNIFDVIGTSSIANNNVQNGIRFRDALDYNCYKTITGDTNMLTQEIDISDDYRVKYDAYKKQLAAYCRDRVNNIAPTVDKTNSLILNSSVNGYKTYDVRRTGANYGDTNIKHMLVVQNKHPSVYLCTYTEETPRTVNQFVDARIYEYTPPPTDTTPDATNTATNSGPAFGGKTRKRKCKTLKRSRKPKPKSRKSKTQKMKLRK